LNNYTRTTTFVLEPILKPNPEKKDHKKHLGRFKLLAALFVMAFMFMASTSYAASLSINVTSPTVTTVAPGANFTITATATATSGYYLYEVAILPYNYNGYNLINNQYPFSTSYTISSNITAPTTPGTYTYQVYASDYSGNTLYTNVTITVSVPTPTVTPSSTTVCANTQVTLTASDSPTGGTYNWYNVATGGTALQSSTSTTYSPTVTANTTYYVSYTYGGSTSARASATVTTTPAPTAGGITAPANVLENTAASISLTGSAVAGYTYSWNFNGGTSSSTTGAGPFSVTWSSSGTKTITLTVTNSSGCPAITTQTITVTPATPTVTASANTICSSGVVTLTAADVDATGGTYSWYNVSSGGTALQSSTSTTYAPTVSATTTYYVSYTNNGLTSARAPITITLSSPPVAGGITAPSVVNAGTAATVSLTGSAVAGNTYSWNFGGGTSSSTTGAGPFSVTWPSYGTYTITLTVTNAGGCPTITTQNITIALPVTATNYAFSQSVTLNTSSLGISSTLTNFPYLVYIQENALKSGANCANNVQFPTGGTNGYDFAFTLSGSSTELFYQVESFNATTGTLLAWVEIPSVTSTNVGLTFYFGAASPLHTTAFTQNTWDTEYMGVYHFDEGSTTASVVDATSNGNTASQGNTTVATGKIGSAYSFNGTNTYITTNSSNSASLNITGSFTLSAWVYTNSPYTKSTAGGGSGEYDYKIMTNEASYSNGGYKMGLYGTSTTTVYPEVETRNNGTAYLDRSTSTSQTAVSTGTWHYVQGIYNSTTGTFYSYLDGALNNSSTGATASSSNLAALYFGSDFGSGNFINGIIDEARVSNDAKTSDWIKAEYKNQNNPSTFTTTGNTIADVLTNSTAIGGSIVYTWTGTTSTDPTVATNWKSSASGTPNVVPPFDGSASLDIPAIAGVNYPKLTASETIYGLTIESGAQLNLNGYTLNVGCHIYNNSTTGGNILYGSSSGTINWNGLLATQYYYGSTNSFMSVGNMTVNNSATGTVQITGGAVALYNTLTLTQGNLVVNNTGSGSLTLMSTSAGSASIAAIPAAYSVTGTVNVQRYMSGNTSALYRSYRLMSSPVNSTSATSGTSNLINFSTLNSTYTVGGTSYYGAFTAGSGSGFNFTNPNPTIYLYNETLNPTAANKNKGFTTGKYAGITSISGTSVNVSNTLMGSSLVQAPVGNGYLLFFIGSTNGRSTSNPESTLPDNANVTNVGYVNQQAVKVNLWYSPTGGTGGNLSYTSTELATNYPGYNMVGNPYASTIDLNQLYSDNYNSSSNAIGSNFYELLDQNPNQAFVVYSASGGTSAPGSSEFIASGQGFMAYASGTGQSLTFKEDQKTSTVATASLNLNAMNRTVNAALATKPDTLQGLHLQLMVDTATTDACGIYFSKNCKDTFDSFDALDMDAINPKAFLSSYTSDNARVALNKMGDYIRGKRIKLYVSATQDGIYKLNLTDFQNIDTTNYRIYLVDNELKDSLDMVAYKSYTFNFYLADTAGYHDRFVLAIENKNSAPYQLLSFSGQKVSQGIQLGWKTENEEDYALFGLEKLENGKYVTIDSLQSNGSGSYNFTDVNAAAGTNTYRLAQNVLGQITYAGPITIDFNSQAANNGFSVYPNPSKSTINVTITTSTASSPTYLAQTYNILGQVMDKRSVSTNSWSQDVSGYRDGVYVIKLTTTSGDVVGTAKFIKVD
jgi:trimeric autotransporter adhesin